ncbi:MAG TPA: IS110 family transposase [Methanosarcina sp.]|nr:IS110 family transposase [Methanosarcina sp.]
MLSPGLIKGVSQSTKSGQLLSLKNKDMKKNHFIGIDVSKDTLDAAMHSLESAVKFEEKRFENNVSGYQAMLSWIKKKKHSLDECVFCMEHTGVYSLNPAVYLCEQELFVSVVPALEIKRSIGVTRGKNDKVDARRIAEFAMDKKEKLSPFQVPGKILLQIKQLLTYRDQLRKECSSFKTSIKSHERYQLNTGMDYVTTELKEMIEQLGKRISDVDKKIEQLIEKDESLKSNSNLIQSVNGIGPVISAFLLVTTANFSSFDDGRKYACYAGVAPFEHSSGISIKGKTAVSHLANKRMKTLLYNAANTAAIYDPELKKYYHRKKSEGKDHKLIMNAICCKLIYRVFAVVKRQSAFVTLYKENFKNDLHRS